MMKGSRIRRNLDITLAFVRMVKEIQFRIVSSWSENGEFVESLALRVI
jgi:hypothetical protein